MAELGNTLVGAVAGLEVKVGSPVVAEVLACVQVSRCVLYVPTNSGYCFFSWNLYLVDTITRKV